MFATHAHTQHVLNDEQDQQAVNTGKTYVNNRLITKKKTGIPSEHLMNKASFSSHSHHFFHTHTYRFFVVAVAAKTKSTNKKVHFKCNLMT